MSKPIYIGRARADIVPELEFPEAPPHDMVKSDLYADVVPAGAGLVWGIKRSLLSHVRRLPDRGISIEDGVGLTPEFEFHFPLNEDIDFYAGEGSTLIPLREVVRLHGHGGALALKLANRGCTW